MAARTRTSPASTFTLSIPLDRCVATVRYGRDIVHDGEMKPGMAGVIGPEQIVSVRPATPLDMAIILVPESMITEASLPGTVGAFLAPARWPAVLRQRYELAGLCHQMKAAFKIRRRQQLVLHGLSLAMLGTMLDGYEEPTQDLDDEQIEHCINYANDRLDQRMNLREWSAAIGMSPSEFARFFQQRTGIAPYTWFMDRRIDRAKLLLSQDRIPLAEVALDSGFCSQSHFSEAFRRRVGVSPGRWRAKMNEPVS